MSHETRDVVAADYPKFRKRANESHVRKKPIRTDLARFQIHGVNGEFEIPSSPG